MRHKGDPPDLTLSEIAARQHGVVSAVQLGAVGLDRSAVRRRVVAGRFHRVHQGVYAVGHQGLSLEARWMAAVLACGKGAVLSHLSGAALWELLRPEAGPVHVSLPTHGGRRNRAGIRLHRCPSLANGRAQQAGTPSSNPESFGLVTVRHGIPVTTPARTLADLEGAVAPRLHRRAKRQAELAGYALPSRTRRLRTRSDLEEDFLDLCRAFRLPSPEVNVRIGPRTVDFVWRAAGVAVETDSYRYHRGAVAFEDDHARDLALRGAGFEVCRFTERQIRDEAGLVAADLRRALRESRSGAGAVGGSAS
jgi:very-short-patch-repair endonuclease